MRLASHSSTHTQHCHPLVDPSFTNPFSLSHICAANPFSIYNSTNLLVFNDDHHVIELYPSGGLSPTTQFYTLHVKWLTLHSMAINSPISSPYKQNVHKSVKFDQEPVMSKPASNIPQVFERHEQKIVLIFLHHQPIGFASEVVNLTCNQSCNQLGKRSFTGQKIPGSQTSSLDSSYVHDSIREEHGS